MKRRIAVALAATFVLLFVLSCAATLYAACVDNKRCSTSGTSCASYCHLPPADPPYGGIVVKENIKSYRKCTTTASGWACETNGTDLVCRYWNNNYNAGPPAYCTPDLTQWYDYTPPACGY
jgi:hypothetical protein